MTGGLNGLILYGLEPKPLEEINPKLYRMLKQYDTIQLKRDGETHEYTVTYAKLESYDTNNWFSLPGNKRYNVRINWKQTHFLVDGKPYGLYKDTNVLKMIN